MNTINHEQEIKLTFAMTDEARVFELRSKLESIRVLAETYADLGKFQQETLIVIADMAKEGLKCAL